MRNIEGGPIQELSPESVATEAQAETQKQIDKIDSLMAEIKATGKEIGNGATKLLEALGKRAKRDVVIASMGLLSACGVQTQNIETTMPEASVVMADDFDTHAVDPEVETNLTDEERRALADVEEPVGAEAILKDDERRALVAAGFDQFRR